MSADITIEGNRKIAVFCGWVEKNAGLWVDESDPTVRQDLKPKCSYGHWNFHSSWDWLRPAMDKCWDSTTETEREFGGLSLFEYGIFTDIETVWNSVIEVIEWLDDKNKKDI